MTPTSIEPQPRIDTLVTGISGAVGRRTEYSGSVWYGDRPDLGGRVVINRTVGARLDEPFFLPDSLPYRTGMAATALVACSVAVESAVEENHQLVRHAAALVPDPRDASLSWVQVTLVGQLYLPVAFSYRVDVIVPPEAVAGGSAADGSGT